MPWLNRFARQGWPPIFLLLCIMSIDIMAFLGYFPSSSALFNYFVDLSASAGKFTIFLLVVAEHTVVLGVYLPASVVILIAMGKTNGNVDEAFLVFCAIFLGQCAGYIISFVLGRLLIRDDYENFGRTSTSALILSFIHPHSGAASAFFLGSSGSGFLRFSLLAGLGLAIWSPLWAVLAYFGVVNVVNKVGWDVVFYGYMIAWIVVVAWRTRHH